MTGSNQQQRSIRDENEAAAQQFLGIVPVQDDLDDDDEQRGFSVVRAPKDDAERQQQQQLSPILLVILAVVALSQIALLVLLVGTDPMLMGDGGGLGETTPSSWMLERVVDAVSGFE